MENKPASKKWLPIILVVIAAMILISAGLFLGLANSGIAKRSPEEIMLPSIDIQGTWKKANMPFLLSDQDGALEFAYQAFWWNDTNGSEAGIFIDLWGYDSTSIPKIVFDERSAFDNSTRMNVSLGDKAFVWIRDNYSLPSYQGELTWNHSCSFFVLKMNYVCAVGLFYQDSSGLNQISAMQVAIEQVNRIQ